MTSNSRGSCSRIRTFDLPSVICVLLTTGLVAGLTVDPPKDFIICSESLQLNSKLLAGTLMVMPLFCDPTACAAGFYTQTWYVHSQTTP